VDSLWVLILLLVAFSTIVTVRLFRNGAREDAGSAPFEELATAEAPAGAVPAPARTKAARVAASAPAAGPAVAATAAASPARGRRRAASQSAPPAAWPGGDCPNCGASTVPSAKFCGECGHRLVP
jgi:hypothetical protein